MKQHQKNNLFHFMMLPESKVERYVDVHQFTTPLKQETLSCFSFDKLIRRAVQTEQWAARVDKPTALTNIKRTYSRSSFWQPHLQQYNRLMEYVKEYPTMHYLGIPRIAWSIIPCTCKIFGNTSPQLCCGNVVNIYYYRGQCQSRTGPR